MTTTVLERAIAFAVAKHAGQRDKAGQPYILHPLRLMLTLPDEPARIAAVLHDVIEDTDATLADLAELGVAGDALEAIRLLTHGPDEPYLDYVRRVAAHPLARRVKRADLLDNLDTSRLAEVTDRDRARLARYRAALAIVDEAG